MPGWDERGDTLVEILVAVVIIGLSAVAFLGSILISTSSSSEHRYLANDDTLARSSIEQIKQQVELATNLAASKFIDCSASATPQSILQSWTTTTSPNYLSLPRPGISPFAQYAGYSVSIAEVQCIAAASGATPSINPDTTCYYSTANGGRGAQSTCGADSSGLLEVSVSVQDPSNYTLTMSTIVRNPAYGASYAADY